jgi:hypothetical protein
MIQDLLAELRTQLEQADNLPDSTRADLLAHLQAMETSHASSVEDADELAADAESAEPVEHEPQGIERLVTSVEELEVSHPEITATVNRIATVLGNMGI